MFVFFPTGDTIEIHYWFDDNTHTMDAYVESKCSYEALAVIKELAHMWDLEITVETHPLAEGGLKRLFKIVSKEEGKKAPITTAIITGLFLGVMGLGWKIGDKLIDKLFEDQEKITMEKEKLRLEVKKLKQDTGEEEKTIEYNSVLKKRKSNFYETLSKYPKVEKVSFLMLDEGKPQPAMEQTVERKDFGKFIMLTDDLPPLTKEDAVIEIIAPVLKKGNYKWIGYYNGDPVPFSMKSKDFKDLVQSGKIQFKNGTSIKCQLKIKRKITNDGEEVNVGYEVLMVKEYFENDTPIETNEGKRHRQRKEAMENQLDLWGRRLDEDDNDPF